MDDSTKPRRAAAAPRRRAGPSPEAMVSPAAQAKIGEALRDLYDGMKSEPIPDRLLLLLQQLEGREGQELPAGGEDADGTRHARGRA